MAHGPNRPWQPGRPAGNLPVLTTDGLVGRVSSVSLTRSQVVLLGDPNCKVSAGVENETRDTGVIGASGPLDTEFVELGYLSRNANLKPGAKRRDQRRGRDLPVGIPIGKMVDVASGRIRPAHRSARETGGEPERAGRSLGDVPMNWPNTAFVLGAAFLAVFWEAAFSGVRHLVGAQIDLLPPLMVYAGLCTGLTTVALLALLGGLWFDSLSANPLGVTVLRCSYRAGDLPATRLDLARPDLRPLVLGLGASAAAPVLTLLVLLTMGHAPLLGWGTLWQLVVLSVGGAVATPICFELFAWLQRTLVHTRAIETSFRPTGKSGGEIRSEYWSMEYEEPTSAVFVTPHSTLHYSSDADLRPTQERRSATAVGGGGGPGRLGRAAGRAVVGAGGVGAGLRGKPRNAVVSHRAHPGGAREDSGPQRRGAGREPAHLQHQFVSRRIAQAFDAAYAEEARRARAELKQQRSELKKQAEPQADQGGAQAVRLHLEGQEPAAAKGAL